MQHHTLGNSIKPSAIEAGIYGSTRYSYRSYAIVIHPILVSSPMLGIRFVKVSPTTYVMHYRNGQLVREGTGLAFFCFGPFAELTYVPLGSVDVPFVFNEVTADFQDATIQGQLTYRIQDPKRAAALLDFSVHANGLYRSEDPTKLPDRLVQAAQISARNFTQQYRLAELLVKSSGLLEEVLKGLKGSEVVTMHGLEVLGLSILSIKGTPEMSKALQADAREQLLRKADEAVFERRNAAVEMERRIKESELNTEIAVEQKKRQVRETQMAADIAVEQQRVALVEQQVENARKESAAKAEALRAMLEPLKGVDWHTLMATSAGASNPQSLIALAFRDLADGAEKIGNLNISPELLTTLLGQAPTHEKKR
jgi:SPFH domain / Band 7 family